MRGTAADMQIAENLALAKRRGQRRGLSWGVTKAEKDEYVELLKRLDLGLDTRLNAKVGLLSGGQRQALTLLMATLTKPRLLLLDEHTAALDPKTASKVLNLTEEIVDENHLTTLMVTHNMNDAIRLGNRLIMMHEGHVIYDVAGDEKSRSPLRPAAEVRGGLGRRARQRPHAAELKPAKKGQVYFGRFYLHKRQNRRNGADTFAAVFANPHIEHRSPSEFDRTGFLMGIMVGRSLGGFPTWNCLSQFFISLHNDGSTTSSGQVSWPSAPPLPPRSRPRPCATCLTATITTPFIQHLHQHRARRHMDDRRQLYPRQLLWH